MTCWSVVAAAKSVLEMGSCWNGDGVVRGEQAAAERRSLIGNVVTEGKSLV